MSGDRGMGGPSGHGPHRRIVGLLAYVREFPAGFPGPKRETENTARKTGRLISAPISDLFSGFRADFGFFPKK